MEDSFKLLEDRIHRAAERLKTLSAEGQALRADLAQAEARAERAEHALASAKEREGAGRGGGPQGGGSGPRALDSQARARGDPRPRREARRASREPIIRPMADKANLVHVEIFGQTYAVKPGTDPGYVEKLAAYVDEQMKDVSRASGAVDSLRVAVLAALNLADECLRLRHDVDEARGVEGPGQHAGRRHPASREEARLGARRLIAFGPCPREARRLSCVEALCLARDGYGNLEPTSFLRGSDSPRGEHASASGSLKRGSGLPPGDPVQVTCHTTMRRASP